MSSGPDPQRGTPVLRQLNRTSVLAVFRDTGAHPQRIVDLVRTTGLTRPTVAQAVTDLEADGWLVRHAPEAPVVGRPAVRYALGERRGLAVGLDVGPHTVTAVVAGPSGAELATARVTVRRRTGRAVLAAVDSALDRLAESAPLDRAAAVVAGTPGLIDADTGTVRMAPSVAGWPAIDLTAALSARLPCAAHIENDANLAALAIAAEHDAPDQTLLTVQWGDRIGAGLIVAGRLHRGATGAAGEIGFITTDPERAEADAQGLGALEHRIGAVALAERAVAAGRRRPRSTLARRLAETPQEPAAALFRAADDGDATAQGVVTDIANEFADAIAPVVLALDPHAVIIGGGVSRAGPRLAFAISQRLGRLALRTPKVAMSALADRAVVSGAVHRALETVWERALG